MYLSLTVPCHFQQIVIAGYFFSCFQEKYISLEKCSEVLHVRGESGSIECPTSKKKTETEFETIIKHMLSNIFLVCLIFFPV